MIPGFWLLAALFHGAVLGVCVARARRWVRMDPPSPGRAAFWRRLAVDALVVGATAFVLALVLAGGLPDPAFAAIRFWSQTLFGEAVLFLAFLSVLHGRRRQVARSVALALPALALLAVYVDAYHVEPWRLQVEEHVLDVAEPLQGAARTIRILHVSDIQTHHVRGYERHVVQAMAALEPDIVFLTGDYVHMRLQPGREETARELAALVRDEGPRPPLGTWAVGGDVDGSAIRARFEESGVRWLEDETATVPLPGGSTLTLVGLAPGTSRERGNGTLRRLLAGAPPGSPRVVLGHSPDFALHLGDGPRVDLALAGHTHGGQIVVPLLGPLLTLSRVPRHVAGGGLHTLGPVRVHVSRGVGLERGSAPQVRFFCPPQICVLTLRYSR